MDYSLDTVGGRIRWAIEEYLGVTQAEFARRTGKRRQLISKWINNPNAKPGRQSIRELAEATGVPAAWIEYGGPLPGAVARETVSVSDTPPDRIDQLYGLLSDPDMLRRMAGRIPRRDLAEMLIGWALKKGLSGDELDRVYELAKGLLDDEKDGS